MKHLGNEGLNTLQGELDKSAVISSQFKNFIMAWAMEACRIAYEKGKEDGKFQIDHR